MSFVPGTKFSVPRAARSDDVRPEATDPPASGAPDSFSAGAPVRILGGSRLVFVRFRICYLHMKISSSALKPRGIPIILDARAIKDRWPVNPFCPQDSSTWVYCVLGSQSFQERMGRIYLNVAFRSVLHELHSWY